MPLDAVRAPGDVRDGHGDQLLRLRRQCVVGKNLAPEGLERRMEVRSEFTALARPLGRGFRIERGGPMGYLLSLSKAVSTKERWAGRHGAQLNPIGTRARDSRRSSSRRRVASSGIARA